MRQPANPDLGPHLDAIEQGMLDCPPEDLPGLMGELERLRVSAWLRATKPQERAVSGPDENLSIKEAARRLGVSVDWLYRNAARLPFTVRICRRVLFSARGLEKWVQRRQGAGAS